MIKMMRFLKKEKPIDQKLLDKNKKTIDNLRRKIDITSLNYANMAKRLLRRKFLFQIMLPYYSVIGILNTLIVRFIDSFNEIQKSYFAFWGIFISISFLVISLQITLAGYPERINDATNKLNSLKVLKGHLEYTNPLKFIDLDLINNRYNEIVSSGALISDRYFYEACKEIDRKNKKDIDSGKTDSEIERHFTPTKIKYIKFTNFLELLLFALMFLLPFIVYIGIILSK